MELIYLYVDRYRNLEPVDYNFSANHTVHYSAKGNALRYERTDRLPEDFFGEQIANVSGIIGMNGSGKSNLI